MGKRICRECKGQGYVIASKGQFAQANICKGCYTICDECHGEGIVLQKKGSGYTYASECSCTFLEKRISLFNKARIPSQFSSASLEDFQISHHTQEEARTNAQKLVDYYPTEKRGLVFMGPIGVGKTHLAVGVIKKLTLEKGCSCKFVDFFHLLSDIKGGYSRGESEKEVLDPFTEVPILVIDELGKGRNNEWEANILDQIISKRYNNSKELTTVITTNYTTMSESTLSYTRTKTSIDRLVSTKEKTFEEEIIQETLQTRIGERMFSRLTEMCKMIEMEGQDFRSLKYRDDDL